MEALVVGGTGPTGPHIVKGLLARGFRVSILHTGSHESEEIPPEVEHIHTDPSSRDAVEKALGGRRFDLAVVTYGGVGKYTKHTCFLNFDELPQDMGVISAANSAPPEEFPLHTGIDSDHGAYVWPTVSGAAPQPPAGEGWWPIIAMDITKEATQRLGLCDGPGPWIAAHRRYRRRVLAVCIYQMVDANGRMIGWWITYSNPNA